MLTGRAAFFFGSGVSFASGAPTIDQITESLLNGAWWRHSDGRFLPCRPDQGTISLGEGKRAQDFLRVIKAEIDPHLLARERRESNYEDIFGAALQIVQDETFEIINPLFSRSLAAIKAVSEPLYLGQEHHIDRNTFASLADRACDLVQWVVYFGLAQAKTPVGLGIVADVALAARSTDIFTLNHDTLIERQLIARGISYADGFGEQSGDVRIYCGNWDKVPVNLLKLHGSSKWYLFRFLDQDQYASVEANQGYAKDEHGVLLDDLDPKPRVLTGTTVKEQSYGVGLFGEIFGKFSELLTKHRTLIFCGYGWGDKGINIRLGYWLEQAKENRIVILHAGSSDEITRKRFWYWRWGRYVDEGKVAIIPKWLADCTIDDLRPFFDE